MMNNYKVLARNISIVFGILLLIPIGAWLSNWHWNSNQSYTSIDFLLFIVTETGSAPYFALITSLLFSIWLSMRCKLLKHHWVMIFMSVLILQGSTQIIKSAIKTLLEEPRPYMAYIVEKGVEIEPFYELPRKERSIVIQEALAEDSTTPKWLQNHWQHETGYSFPSGHTIFAVMWAFIIVGFLSREKDPKTHLAMIIMTVWAGLMMISRMRLGMHFPIDLFVSTIIAYLIALFFFYFLAKRDSLTNDVFHEVAPTKQKVTLKGSEK
ncbi:phosphatase PAP2 family protein [Ignatzschineria sp. LJL83]